MAETTHISWADATLSFWIGCTKIGPACDHCYAELYGNRFGVKWGPKMLRRATMHWIAKARKLERLAVKKLARGEGAFFCFSNSLSDIFDKEVPIEWLAGAFAAMREAPHVTFLLLTKRPQLIESRSKAAGGLPPNAAIGCTVVNQKEADRDLPWLLTALANLGALFAFVSMEPLLEYVDIIWALSKNPLDLAAGILRRGLFSLGLETLRRIGWVITGGESGVHARRTPDGAFQGLQAQCAIMGVPFQHKQNGEWLPRSQLGWIDAEIDHCFWEDDQVRVGKDCAGRLLDGVEHSARPEVRV